MKTRSTYQNGSLILHKRSRLPDCWEFRYYRYDSDGNQTYVRDVLGDIVDFPTRASIMKKVQEKREEINSQRVCIFFRDLVKRYKQEVLPKKRPHTQTTDLANLRYLEDAFELRRLDSITPGEIDTWINTLTSQKYPGKPLSKLTRQHIKALAHHIWRQAMLWGVLKVQVNPIEIVRVNEGARRKIRSAIVSPAQYRSLMADQDLPCATRVMIQVAMVTGLRVSEILGLRWDDIDFKQCIINVRRSIVGKDLGETKNIDSEAPVPMHRALARTLRWWRRKEPCWGGWIFGSAITERPFHSGAMQSNHLKPAGQRVGIPNLGWHAFRHTHSADLEAAGASDRVQQASMRHGDAAMTKHYGKHSPALMEKMKAAQAKVIQRLEGNSGSSKQDRNEK